MMDEDVRAFYESIGLKPGTDDLVYDEQSPWNEVGHDMLRDFYAGRLSPDEAREVAYLVTHHRTWYEADQKYLRGELSAADAPGGATPLRLVGLSKVQSWRRRSVIASVAAMAAMIVVALGLLVWNPWRGDGGVVARLDDGGGRVTLYRDGRLEGLEYLPPELAGEARAALGGNVDAPAQLQELSSGLKAGSEHFAALVAPVGTAVRSPQPTLRWQARPAARNYLARVYDDADVKVRESPPLPQTQWTLPLALEPGRVYTWEIVASENGRDYLAPSGKPRPKFRVLDAAELAELEKLEAGLRGSHLARGLLYLQFGLVDEAVEEFQALAAANPDAKVAQQLEEHIRAMRLQYR